MLAAERQIQRVLTGYAHALDRHDWEAVRRCFHEDAHDDHLDYKGGIDGLIAWLQDRHASLHHSVHHLGNVLIEVESEHRAASEAYCITLQRSAVDGQLRDLFVHSRYVDVHERRGEGPWKIARRKVVYGLSRSAPAGEGLELGAASAGNWLTAAFGPTDPVFDLPGFDWFSER